MNRALPSEIRNRKGQRIDFATHPGDPKNPTLVILGHGVTGNKDRPLLVTLAEKLAENGITAIRISFAGNGASEGRFEDCTISSEVEDLGSVIDALTGWNIAYAGHSMGAAVGVLRASADRRIRFLISLAGMARTAEFARREFGDVQPGRGVMWDKPECPLSQAFVDDMNRIGDVLEAGRRVHVPWLLVHGTNDDVVPIQDSRDLDLQTSEPRRLVEIPDADHVFSPPHDKAMAEIVVGWIRERKLAL